MKYVELDDVLNVIGNADLYAIDRDKLWKEINKLETTEEPRKRGEWIPISYDGYADGYPVYDEYECSECEYTHSGEEDTLTNYCPNCGADMREVEDER